MSRQCVDNKADRETGAYWEREFCKLAADYGKLFTPHQIGRPDQSASDYGRAASGWSRLLLPDVTIWSMPGEHHEIKHKNQTRKGMYGLELYRLEALARFANTTGQRVYYTIHDWGIAGARTSVEDRCVSAPCSMICYWTAARYFLPLGEVWQGLTEAAS